jgi:integrase
MLAVLDEMQKRRTDESDDALVFPSQLGHRRGEAIAVATLAVFLSATLKWETKIVVHGFRSTLKDWWRANGYPMDLLEIQFDHVLGNQVGQAYGHDTLLEHRRRYMELWGEYCSKPTPEPKAGEVVSLSSKRRPA